MQMFPLRTELSTDLCRMSKFRPIGNACYVPKVSSLTRIPDFTPKSIRHIGGVRFLCTLVNRFILVAALRLPVISLWLLKAYVKKFRNCVKVS